MRYSKKKRNIRNKKRVVSSKRLQKAGYSKKKRIQKSRKNKKVLSKKRQKGGGALNSIMSMVPFMSSGDDIEFDENSVNDVDETQNVLVSALCNQYLKNNIRGTIKTEYDPVLDSLCAGANISSLPRNNSINNFSSNSVGLKPKRSKKKPSRPVKLSQKSDVEAVEGSQSGGVKLPSFLGGIKGLASFYSMPLRTGIKAVNSGINSIKEYSSKKKSEKSESESSSSSSKKEKKAKESSSSESTGSTNPTSTDIDSDIERAEAEILKETSNNNEARDEVVNGLTDNKNLDIKEVIKK